VINKICQETRKLDQNIVALLWSSVYNVLKKQSTTRCSTVTDKQ